jgi:hypothetical protein
MADPWPSDAGIKIGSLPLDASVDYLRGMMAMVSNEFTSLLVTYEEPEGTTGFATFTTTSEAERLIEALDGIPNGAMVGKVLKVERMACRRATTTKRTSESDIPDAKKSRNRTWPPPLDTEDSVPSQTADLPADRVRNARLVLGWGAVEGDEDERERAGSAGPSPMRADRIPSPVSDPIPASLADMLTKFSLPPVPCNYINQHAKFELKIRLSALQRVVNLTCKPDPHRLAYQTPGAALKDFLFDKILGPDGANLSRLSKEGAQVSVMGNSSVGILDPALHILITSDSHYPLRMASQQVENLLRAVTDFLLGRSLQSHGSGRLLQFQT